MTSPTARTLKKLRDEGWIAGVVEKFNSFTKRRIDLFGFVDIVAVRGTEVLLVQATSSAHLAERIAKATALPEFHTVNQAARVEFWGWSKRGAAGKRKLWDVRIESVERA